MRSGTTDPPDSLPSGRFVLRLDPREHSRLREAAKRNGMSLNELCARFLSAEGAGSALSGGPAPAVARARQWFGDDLVGVAAYGSWTRGEATPSSDLDVLVVVRDSVRLGRELYRRWDEDPLTWEGLSIDVHFTHLPDSERRVAGLWSEVALDGIVLLDRELLLSRRLVRVRRDIAEGRIVRRSVHGQPYWVTGEVA